MSITEFTIKKCLEKHPNGTDVNPFSSRHHTPSHFSSQEATKLRSFVCDYIRGKRHQDEDPSLGLVLRDVNIIGEVEDFCREYQLFPYAANVLVWLAELRDEVQGVMEIELWQRIVEETTMMEDGLNRDRE